MWALEEYGWPFQFCARAGLPWQNTMTKNNSVGVGVTCSPFLLITVYALNNMRQGRNSRKEQRQKPQRNDANRLASLDHTQLFILYNLGPPPYTWCCLQGSGCSHFNHQSRQFPPDMSSGQTDVSYSFIDILSSQVTWVCIKLTIKMTSTQVRYSLWSQKSSFFAYVEVKKHLCW